MSAPIVTVKPLIWISSGPPDKWGWITHTAALGWKPEANRLHIVIIEYAQGECSYGSRRYSTLEAAQAAAQLEWEGFILSAIVSQSDTGTAAQQGPNRYEA